MLFKTTSGEQPSYHEIGKLLSYLRSKGIQPVALSNRDWTLGETRETARPIDEVMSNDYFPFPWFIAGRQGSGVPQKPKKESITHVLSAMGWKPREVLYLGNNDADMKTAHNASLLFLSAQWYANQQYGIKCDTPRDVGRFIDLFCIRRSSWHFEVHGDEAEFYSLGTYAFLEAQYQRISQDAKEAAKFGRGHPEFWMKYLLSTIYFSGIEFDYIATFPSSRKGIVSSIHPDTVIAFAKCFHKKYLPDLIQRHTDSINSAGSRRPGQVEVDHANQLNTIHLKELPLKNGESYKSSPLKKGKTVLVIDDFCTRGFAQEAARIFINQTGAKAIGLSLLKTINRGYRELVYFEPNNFDPYMPQRFENVVFSEHSYNSCVKDTTHSEIEDKLQAFDYWSWPQNI